MKGFWLRWLINTIAVAVAAHLPGIHYTGLPALGLAALLLGVVNAIVRPLLLLLSLPLIIVTLGLFIFVVNGFSLWLVSVLVPGFEVHSFGSALLGALVISVVSWALGRLLCEETTMARPTRRSGGDGLKSVSGRVIDP